MVCDISACAMSEVKLPVMDPHVPNLRQTKQNKTKQNYERGFKLVVIRLHSTGLIREIFRLLRTFDLGPEDGKHMGVLHIKWVSSAGDENHREYLSD